MSPIEIREIRRERRGGYEELSAYVTGFAKDRLWFRFPARWADFVEESPEPFLAALLPIAMSKNRPLLVEGQVSPEFKRGIEQIARLYHGWDRRLRQVKIEVQTKHRVDNGVRGTGCFFTGGVDSLYTVLKNLAREHGDNRITHLIFIRGYAECPLENSELGDNLTERLRAAAAALKLELILVETNLQSFTPSTGIAWDWFAGSHLAAAGLCLKAGLRRLYIAAGDTYSTLSPWGSHPLVDPLWSTEWVEFRHDGCEAFRSEKLKWVVQSASALEQLWVCGYDPSGLRNCGTCEKCLRTMIGLAALGVEAPPSLFAEPLDLARVRRLDGGNRVIRYYLRDNLNLLVETGRAAPVEAAVRRALQPNLARWLARVSQEAAREMDRFLLGGRIRSWALGAAGANPVKHADLRASPWTWFLYEALKLAGRRTRKAP